MSDLNPTNSTRVYLVVPEGTPVFTVVASSPKVAANKVRRGKGTPQDSQVVVVPVSRVRVPDPRAKVLPGQLSLV